MRVDLTRQIHSHHGVPGAAFDGAGDIASYALAGSAVRADLRATFFSFFAPGQTGDAAGDRFDLVEGLVGSSFDDTLTGDEGEDQLTGGAGNDLLRDTSGATAALYGGAGDDLFQIASARFTGGTISGGTGVDRLAPLRAMLVADLIRAAVLLGLDRKSVV